MRPLCIKGNMQPENAVSTKKSWIQSALIVEEKAIWWLGKDARPSQSSKNPQQGSPKKITLQAAADKKRKVEKRSKKKYGNNNGQSH
ncbi:hypothetical protein AVEN_128049-1 [Araneus ventricosus]|uniref:Uncharacterized protein n=1 Tax=Araneus ventricosus TaxID=182803 RepID=A0A4Y1ZZL7_ARAVE|nr:hypothetical protein AVEN_128049-1 [Araneus ventricosus]